MFKQTKSLEKMVTSDIAATVIGAGITIEGAIFKGKGTVRIDGTYIGNMDVDGNIVIGENGIVKGIIKSDKVLIAGQVEGNINCNDDVHFTATSVVVGDVVSLSLVIDEGAQFNGRCTMNNNSSHGDKPVLLSPVSNSIMPDPLIQNDTVSN